MDHIGIAVPNLDEASHFLERAFDAKPMYDNIKRSEPPQTGPNAEAMLGISSGTKLVTMRMLQLGNGPGIELFEMHGSDQHKPARPSDFGLQHFAVYVDDLAYASERFQAAGGTLLEGPNEMLGLEKGPGNGWRYGRTPWGSIVELMTSPSPEDYERETPLRRWKPAPVDPAKGNE